MLYNESVEYLNKVIDKWASFCKTHRLMFESIKVILEDNIAKHEQINNLTVILKEKNEEIATLKAQNNILLLKDSFVEKPERKSRRVL